MVAFITVIFFLSGTISGATDFDSGCSSFSGNLHSSCQLSIAATFFAGAALY
jgi:hypothetical protein